MQLLVSALADWLVILIVIISVVSLLLLVPARGRYDTYMRILMAGVTSYFTAKIIGLVWQPQAMRPFELLGVEPGAAYLNNPGFPSDHVLFATFLVIAVAYAVGKRWLVFLLAGMTLLVALGRVLALVHTPLDVVGGVVIACVGVVWYMPGFDTKLKRLVKKPSA